MVLTAIVISFGVSALLISLIYRVYVAHRSVDIEHLSDFEERLCSSRRSRFPPSQASAYWKIASWMTRESKLSAAGSRPEREGTE